MCNAASNHPQLSRKIDICDLKIYALWKDVIALCSQFHVCKQLDEKSNPFPYCPFRDYNGSDVTF